MIQFNILDTSACPYHQNREEILCHYTWVSICLGQLYPNPEQLLNTDTASNTIYHRNTGGCLQGPLFNLLLKQVHSDQIAQDWIIWVSSISREGDFTTFWGPGPVHSHPQRKEDFQNGLSMFQSVPNAHCLVLVSWKPPLRGRTGPALSAFPIREMFLFPNLPLSASLGPPHHFMSLWLRSPELDTAPQMWPR